MSKRYGNTSRDERLDRDDFEAADVDPRRDLYLFAKKVLIVFAIGAGCVLLWYVRAIIILVFLAAIIAAGIEPSVHRVRIMVRHRFGRRIQRGTAVLIVYFPFVLGAVLLVALTLPQLFSESRQLATTLPGAIDAKILRPLEHYFPVTEARQALSDGRIVKSIPIFVVVKRGAEVVTAVIAVLFMIAYMLIDAERLRNLVLLLYPAEHRSKKRRTIKRISRRMSSWLSAQLLLSLIMGVATFLYLVILRIPYALPLAALATIGELVPVIGPIVGSSAALLVALFQSPWQFWSVLVMAIVIQKVENYVLVPRLMGRKVSVSALAVFLAFMIGGTLLGVVGALLAVPAAAILQVIFDEAFVVRRERRLNAERPGTLFKGTR